MSHLTSFQPLFLSVVISSALFSSPVFAGLQHSEHLNHGKVSEELKQSEHVDHSEHGKLSGEQKQSEQVEHSNHGKISAKVDHSQHQNSQKLHKNSEKVDHSQHQKGAENTKMSDDFQQKAPIHNEIKTPIPVITDEDRRAAFPDLKLHMPHPPSVIYFFSVDELEVWDAKPGTAQVWNAHAWIGNDINRVWLRSEGERVNSDTEDADIEVLYGRGVAPWWDILVGAKKGLTSNDSRTWAAFGVQGFAPYKFEVESMLYWGQNGQVMGKFSAEYSLLLTNKWILQPELEATLFAKNDVFRNEGSGLSDIQASLRLRYEITRQFAPYIGVVHQSFVGNTANFYRKNEHSPEDTRVVIGLKFWF